MRRDAKVVPEPLRACGDRIGRSVPKIGHDVIFVLLNEDSVHFDRRRTVPVDLNIAYLNEGLPPYLLHTTHTHHHQTDVQILDRQFLTVCRAFVIGSSSSSSREGSSEEDQRCGRCCWLRNVSE